MQVVGSFTEFERAMLREQTRNEIDITPGLRAFYGDFTTPDKTSSHDTLGFTVLYIKTAKTLHDRKFLKRNDLSRKPDGGIPFT